MRRSLLAFVSSLGGLAAALKPVAGSWPGRYGPYFRTGSTQADETTRKQVASGEIWGKADRGSNFPSVDAFIGLLPDDKPGVEFYTDATPTPGQPPGYARWLGGPGVTIEGEWAKIKANITNTRFRS